MQVRDLEFLRAHTIIRASRRKFGVLDLSTEKVETAATVDERIRRAFRYAPAARLVAAPDCGMKYLSRDAAYGKLEALVEGARLASQAAR